MIFTSSGNTRKELWKGENIPFVAKLPKIITFVVHQFITNSL